MSKEATIPVKVYVSQQTHQAVRELAARDERSMNWLIRKWINEAIERARAAA